MTTTFHKTYKSQKDIPTIIFLIVWLTVLYIKVPDLLTEVNYLLLFLAGLLLLYIVKYLTWAIMGLLEIQIDLDQLTVRKKIMGIGFSKKYDLTLIKNPREGENKPSGTHWNFGGIWVNDKDKRILSFEYRNDKVTLGSKVANFDPFEIIKHLRKAYA